MIMTAKRYFYGGVWTILLLGAFATSAFSDDFDQLVEMLRKDSSDDAELADKLLQAARGVEGNDDLKTRLIGEAYTCGMKGKNGYEAARSAADEMLSSDTKQMDEWRLKRLDVFEKIWQASPIASKKEYGIAYIDELMSTADKISESNGGAKIANDLFLKATRIVNYYAPEKKVVIADKIKNLRQQLQLEGKVETLKKKVASSPDDSDSREQLILLYISELNKPDAAAKLVDANSSEEIRTYVALVVGKLDEVPEGSALELANWYKELSAKATNKGKIVCLSHAKAYLERFLELHTTTDPKQIIAKTMLNQVEEDLAELGSTGGGGLPAAISTTGCNLNLPRKIGLVKTYEGHNAQPGKIAITPNGKLIASYARGDETIRIWQTETGKELKKFPYSKGIRQMQFTPDGKHLLMQRNTFYRFDLSTGEETNVIRYREYHKGEKSNYSMAAFSPDGSIACILLAVDGDNKPLSICVFDMQKGELIKQIPMSRKMTLDQKTRAEISPNGKQVAISGTEEGMSVMELYDIQSGKKIHTFGKGLTGESATFQFSADGKMLMTCNSADKGKSPLIFWSTLTGGELTRMMEDSDKWNGRAILSPDGNRIASSGRRDTEIIDIKSGKVIHTIEELGKGNFSNPPIFTPCGRYLICVPRDDKIKGNPIWCVGVSQ